MAQNKKANGKVVHYEQAAANKSAKPKKKKKRTSPILVFTMVLFLIIFVYMMKYLVDFASGGTSVGIESVGYGSIDIPNTFDGLVVRDEYVVSTKMGGEPAFIYSEGDRVKKNAVVCVVKESETAEKAEDRLRMIDENIIETQKNRVDISKYKDDILRAEKSIASSVLSAQKGIAAGNYNDVYTMRTAVSNQMDIRTQIWINENSETSDSLASERRTYQTQLSNSTETLRTAESGILVLSCDGAEEKFTSENISTVTEKDIKDSYGITYLSKTTAVEEEKPVFKIIESNTWYICSYIENSIASEWSVGNTKTISTVIDKAEKSVQAEISQLVPGGSKTFVVFKVNRGLQDFLSVRTIDFFISDSSYEGLKIPNTAIIQKTFIKVPVDCVMESLDGKSVIKRVDGKDSLVEIEVASSDDQYAYVRQDFDILKIGDTLIKGTGETAIEYKLSEVSTKVGVLVANGAFAEFAGINVLGQNSQYTIADAKTSALKAYDKIITDATDVSEGAEIW